MTYIATTDEIFFAVVIRFLSIVISGSAELVIQRRLWIHIPVSEFRDGGSVNSDTLSLFWISAVTETIRHTTRYVQELSLMFAKDLSVQIKFLSVQIL